MKCTLSDKRARALAGLGASLLILPALATDYYVDPLGDDTSNNGRSASAPFRTIDKAVATATSSADAIYVAPGTYSTTTQWGPNLKARLVGRGKTRNDVTIQSSGSYRTLRMASGSWLENVTVIGEGTFKADKGGAIEMSGGTLTNCVVRNGTTYANGGNIYMSAGVVADCLVSNGSISSTSTSWDGPKGVNVFIDGSSARLLRTHVSGGSTVPTKDDGSLYYERGSVAVYNSGAQIDSCLIDGSACGGLLLQSANSQVYSTTIAGNTCYGVWSWKTSQTVANCALYGNRKADSSLANWAGNQPNSSTTTGCAAENGTFTSSLSYVTITAAAFLDTAKGNYRPDPTGALVDAGKADPRASGASVKDIDGNPRKSGRIDIGCYEHQKRDVSVKISNVSFNRGVPPATATFTHEIAYSASPETVEYIYDFGDGNTATTSSATISHTYSSAGVYNVKVVASNACEEEFVEASYPKLVALSSSTIYVTAGNGTGTSPYDTPAKGMGSLSAAVEAAGEGCTICVGKGVYETARQITVDKSVTIRGLGTKPEDVIIRNTSATPSGADFRVMEFNGANGRLENVTLENGRVENANGANLRLVAGVVSNCVIRGGIAAVSGSANAAGGGVEIAGAATLTHCVVTNNTVNGTSAENSRTGGAIFIPYGAKPVRISNCLVANNRYVTSGTAKAGAAGIRFGGGNEGSSVENCTIAANTVQGSLTDDSAGLFCTSWSVRMRNCIIVGNNETGKDRNTSVKLDFNSGNGFSYLNNMTDDTLIASSGTKSTGNLLVSSPTAVFRNFAGGNYNLRSDSPAFNAGTGSNLSLNPSVDLAGKQRTMHGTIDMGCYESQNAELSVQITGATYNQAYAPATVTFTHSSANSASPANVVYTYDFGDGSETAKTSAGTISHVYNTPGTYTVKITASNAVAGEIVQETYAGYISVASSTVYVKPGNGGGTFPYDTLARGFGTIAAALDAAADGHVIMLGSGVHQTSGQIAVSKAVTIRGAGAKPDDVIIRNVSTTASAGNFRVLELSNANGRLENVTLENGRVENANGGNLRLVSGVVSNCVIRGGTAAVSGSANAAGGGVEIAGAATLTHCVVSNNTVSGTSSTDNSRTGGAIFIPYGAKSVRISNCLVANNRYVTSGNAKSGAAGIRFGGGNENSSVENCTIAANTVQGSLTDDSAGLFCTSWSMRMRNCIIVGNYETAKGNYTSVKLDFNSGNSYTYLNNVTDGALIENDGNKSKGNLLVDGPEAVFRNFSAGDFALRSMSAAKDAGSEEELALAPSVDLSGKPRVKFDAIDAGCYERQSEDMTAAISGVSASAPFAPSTVTFTHTCANSEAPSGVVYRYDFGDGSAAAETAAGTISHTYVAPGLYTVSMTAVNAALGEVAQAVWGEKVRVGSSVIYVKPGNGAGTFPYNSPDKGFGDIQSAVDEAYDGNTILVGNGVYSVSGQIVVSKAVTIRGTGARPEDVILRNVSTTASAGNFRVMELDNTNGRVENVTLENGRVQNANGGNLSLVKGVVSNCVIRGGIAAVSGSNANAAGGGVEIAGAGILTHCIVSNNVTNGTSSNDAFKGGAVYIAHGKESARISNCLIAFNRYVQTTANTVGSAGIKFGGSNDRTTIENCTVAANTVEGSLRDDSAGIYCTTWYARLRNNVVAGNYETGKGRNTSVKLDLNENNLYTYRNNVTDGALIANDGVKSEDNKFVDGPEAVFRNFASRDFALRSGSVANDGGTTNDLALTPAVDLSGNVRLRFSNIDAGCYERQVEDMTATVTGATYASAFAPSTYTFSHSAANSESPSSLVYTYDFGDGTPSAQTTGGTISHVFGTPGEYTVTMTAANESIGEVAQAGYGEKVRVGSSVIYVKPGNGEGAFPYDTPEKGFGSIADAVNEASDGCTIILTKGVHQTSGQIIVNKAVTVRGAGTKPEDVIIRNVSATASAGNFRVMELSNANGRVENVTLENGRVQNANGANLRLVSGVVSNCVIRGGIAAVSENGNAAGGGVEIAGAATLTHCVVTNNTVNGTSAENSRTGGAIFIPYGAKPVRISNCLVANNRYVTSGTAKAGSAGIRFGGGNERSSVENCTIAANTVQGSLTDDSAGIYCTSWSVKLRNNLIAGNFETGKEKFTSATVTFKEGVDNEFEYRNNAMDGAPIVNDGAKSTGNRSIAGPEAVFTNFASDDFTIRAGCAAHDTGKTEGLALAPSVDLFGCERVKFGKIDIGCCECKYMRGFSIRIR